jgi:hypothetical protein
MTRPRRQTPENFCVAFVAFFLRAKKRRGDGRRYLPGQYHESRRAVEITDAGLGKKPGSKLQRDKFQEKTGTGIC